MVSAKQEPHTKAENFTWSGSIYLCAGSCDLDLHNDYDFVGYSYDVSRRFLSMRWQLGMGEWVDAALPEQVILNIFDVDYFRFGPRDSDIPFTEDACLASFGYASDDAWANGHFWTDGPVDPNWRWSFEFQSGADIVIGGGRAVVLLDTVSN